jgi:hypothetical protein
MKTGFPHAYIAAEDSSKPAKLQQQRTAIDNWKYRR